MSAMPPPLLTIAELAEHLKVPVGTVEKKVSARAWPVTWIGRHARFSAEDVAAIIAAGHEAPAITPHAPTPIRRIA